MVLIRVFVLVLALGAKAPSADRVELRETSKPGDASRSTIELKAEGTFQPASGRTLPYVLARADKSPVAGIVDVSSIADAGPRPSESPAYQDLSLGIQRGVQLAYILPSLATPREVQAIGAPWAPWRTLASWYLWRFVDEVNGGQLGD